MGYINVDDKKIYMESYGAIENKALLYLHGGPGASCLDFTKQAQEIGASYHVIAIDQYGVLRSDAISDDCKYGMKMQVQMLEQIRNKLNIENWSLLGHSYGGMLACLYAYLYPSSINTIIYECPSFNFSMSTKSSAEYLLKYFIQKKDTNGINICHKILTKVYKANDKTVFEDVIEMLNLVSDPKVRNYLHNISYGEYASSFSDKDITPEMWRRGNVHLEKLIDDGMMFSNFLTLLKSIHKPSLLITGKFDPVCREEQIRSFMKYSPNGHVVEFEESGHFPRIEEAQKYTKCVCQFLDNFAK